MSLLNWDDDYSVGVKKFDDQHKKMFGLINGLFESMKELDKGYRKKLLQELTDYGQHHLETEEKYFDKLNYPKKEEHKKAHDSYRAKIKEFVENKDDTFLPFDIIDYLEDWWLGHIATVDKEYQDFFSKHKI